MNKSDLEGSPYLKALDRTAANRKAGFDAVREADRHRKEGHK